METPAKIISLIALVATVVPSLLYFSGAVTHDVVKLVALIGTIVWFIATPIWIGRTLPIDAGEVEI